MTNFHELEFDGKHPDLAGIEEAVRTRGCALIRNVYSQEELQAFHRRAVTAYMARGWMAKQGLLNEEFKKNVTDFNHIHLLDLDPSEEERYSFQQLFIRSCLLPFAHHMIGDRVSTPILVAAPRRQLPYNATEHSNPVPFHQDGSFLGANPLFLNFWTPLTPCGKDRPGLELVTVPMDRLIPPAGEFDGGDTGAYHDIDLSQAFIEKLFDRKFFWHPEMALGDVLIFSQMTLHRTHLTPEMTKQRISVELRCANPDLLPEIYHKHLYLYP